MNLTFSEVLDFLEQYQIAPKFSIGDAFDLRNKYTEPGYDVKVEITDILLTSKECKFIYEVKGLATGWLDYYTEDTLALYRGLNG